jgi:uncharacterized protein (DUF2062 family)
MLPGLSGLAGLSASLLVGTTTLGLAAAVLTWLGAFCVMRVRRQRRRGRRGADASRHAA